MMTPDAAIGFDYKNLRNRTKPHSYSVLRARFDAWFAEQAEKAGAVVVPETVVDRLIVKNNQVVGVGNRRGDDVYADVVIVCEGIGLGAGLLEKNRHQRQAVAAQASAERGRDGGQRDHGSSIRA